MAHSNLLVFSLWFLVDLYTVRGYCRISATVVGWCGAYRKRTARGGCPTRELASYEARGAEISNVATLRSADP